MAIQSFIFGPGQKFKSQEDLNRARELVKQIYGDIGAPKNVGEGLSALGDGILANVMNRRINKGQGEFDANRASADSSFISGMPSLTPPAFPSSVATGGSPTAPAATGVPSGAQAAPGVAPEIRDGIAQTASSLGIDPVDLATAISYETAGTFDPRKKGPRTQYGQHEGLIQFGEPQAKQYGVDWNDPVGSQLGENGAVAKYLRNAGVQPGMGMLDIYSAINAGRVGKYNASDANNGGAPGTVRDKVQQQMAGHRAKAIALFGSQAPVQVASLDPSVGMEQAYAPQGQQAPAAQAINRVAPQGMARTGEPMLVDDAKGPRMESDYLGTNNDPNARPYSGPGATVDPRASVIDQQKQVAASQGYVNGQATGLAAARPSNYPEQGKVAPVDWTDQPQLSAAAGLPFQGSPQPQGQQIAALPPQQGGQGQGAPQGAGSPGEVRRGPDGQTYQYAETSGMAGANGSNGWIRVNSGQGPSTQMLAMNDKVLGGALAPQGQRPVQVADNGGYFPPAPSMSQSGDFPPAPSMDRAPIQQQAPQQSGDRLQYLARALSNPFLSPEMKQVAASQYQQEVSRQQQMSDPNYQLDLQYKKAQLDALKAKPAGKIGFMNLPDGTIVRTNDATGDIQPVYKGDRAFKPLITPEQRSAFGIPAEDKRPYQVGPDGKLDAISTGQNISIETSDQVETRRRLAEANGLKQGDPAYQSYILTGKMPREDASPLTATDKKAILEADEMVMTNQNAIDQLASTINGDPGKTLNDKAGYGATAGWQSWAARNDPTGLFSDDKGEATTEFNNIVLGQALGSLKATFGGNPTEGERAILLDLQASVDKTPAERKSIIQRGIQLANKRLQFNQKRADELRGQTFYKPGGGGIPNAPAPSADGWQDIGGGVRVRVK